MKNLILLFTVCAVCGAASQLSAAVVGYWRFEDGAFMADSGPNAFTLSAGGTAPGQTPLPADYPTTVAGFPNGSAASFGGDGRFTSPDNDLFTDSTFTMEAFVTTTSDIGSGTRMVAGQWNATGNQRGWLLGVSDANVLTFQYSPNGTNSVAISSGFSLATNTAYYISVAVDMADTSNGITFYLQDLTNGGILETFSLGPQHTSFFNSSAPFTIGSTAGGTSLWSGTIDEVRLSDEKLGSGQLLIPEPASIALSGLGAIVIGLRRRR